MTEPTDAEIESAWTEATGSGILPYPDDMLAFARAVLAKWGTPPAVAGEPVSWIGVSSHHLLQPTQAQAGAVPQYRLLQSGVDRIEAADEFLSDDATTWAIDPKGIFVGNIYGGHVLRTARRRIKGGQHGADT